MRIVNYIEHPRLKITIFHYQDAYSVKCEASKMEQTIQFRENEMSTDLEVIDFMKNGLIDKIDQLFFDISSARVLSSKLKSEEDNFDVII